MSESSEESIKRIKAARIRLKAEIDVAKLQLPEHVAATLHYDGKQITISRYPEFKELIEAITP